LLLLMHQDLLLLLHDLKPLCLILLNQLRGILLSCWNSPNVLITILCLPPIGNRGPPYTNASVRRKAEGREGGKSNSAANHLKVAFFT
jgi:hypothetical protein